MKDVDGKLGYIAKSKEEPSKIVIDGKVRVEAEGIKDFGVIDGKLIYRVGWNDIMMEDGTKIEGFDALFQIKNAVEAGKYQLPGGK